MWWAKSCVGGNLCWHLFGEKFWLHGRFLGHAVMQPSKPLIFKGPTSLFLTTACHQPAIGSSWPTIALRCYWNSRTSGILYSICDYLSIVSFHGYVQSAFLGFNSVQKVQKRKNPGGAEITSSEPHGHRVLANCLALALLQIVNIRVQSRCCNQSDYNQVYSVLRGVRSSFNRPDTISKLLQWSGESVALRDLVLSSHSDC